jgi:predicted DNA-binding transcriptional regulator AlpA
MEVESVCVGGSVQGGAAVNERLIDAVAVAEMLAVSQSWVRDHTPRDKGKRSRRRPELPVVRLGGAVRYRPSAIDEFLQRVERGEAS